MGSKKQIGPVTTYIAQELRAQRARLQMSYDELAARSGVSKPTVIGCLKGERTVALEVYIVLCKALELDPVQLIDEAVQAEEASEASREERLATEDAAAPAPEPRREERPLTMQEIKYQQLLEAAMPVEIAADDRPWVGEDDDWEPR